MAKIATNFYEIPPWMEKINRLQRQLNLLMEPLSQVCSDYLTITSNIFATLNTPAMQNALKAARAVTPDITTAVLQAQETLEKVYTPELASVIRLQDLMANIIPSNQWTQLSAQIQEWSHSLLGPISTLPSPQKAAELSRLSKLAAESVPTQKIDSVQPLSEDEQKIVSSQVTAIISDKNWEQRFAESVKGFSQTHPVIAWVLAFVFLPIILNLLCNRLSPSSGQTVAPAKVYELPQTSSSVVFHVNPNQTVMIIDEVPYYYGIEVTDEAGQRQAGYISKRSVLLIPASENASPKADGQEALTRQEAP